MGGLKLIKNLLQLKKMNILKVLVFVIIRLSNVKVRHHCHIAAHRDCNINLGLENYEIPMESHNLKYYNAHLIMQKLGKFDFKINIIPNGLEKYTSFSLDN